MYLRRKVDDFLIEWKQDKQRKPLIIKGARQIGKTYSIKKFAEKNYKNIIEINFALQPEYMDIFDTGFEVDTILKNISFKNPSYQFIPEETLIFFDELQVNPSCATSLKSFSLDGRFDVICSGSLMGIYYKEIESNSVGYKKDYEMHSMDFEEFLWAKGYSDSQIDELLEHMINLEPFSDGYMTVMTEIFHEYMTLGGMPAVVLRFIENKNYSGILDMQKQLIADYEEDITKYAKGLDKAKILSIYRSIPVFLGKDNKKFQISKVAKGARNREYVGTVDWLKDAGIVNICYCMSEPALPIKGNFDISMYKLYFHDTGLLIATLDEEAQTDLRNNRNFNAYKGAIYENVIAEILHKQGYDICYYINEKSTVEMDFMVRDTDSLIPVEVKSTDGATRSLNNLIDKDKYEDIRYGIKFAEKNIGFNGKFYTFPYFTSFLLKRYLKSNKRYLHNTIDNF